MNASTTRNCFSLPSIHFAYVTILDLLEKLSDSPCMEFVALFLQKLNH